MKNMSFKRKWFELKRLMRRRSRLLIVLTAISTLIVFVFKYPSHFYQEQEHGDDQFINNERSGRQNDIEQSNWRDTEKDIGARSDPFTVFKRGQLGNYEPKKPQSHSNGPGEEGRGVNEDMNSAAARAAMMEFGFNTHASDQISLNRSIPDTRDPECKYWHYPETGLPTASVVVVFHNEGWTPLMRTVHSVLLRSPPELLREVLLVDDFSDKEHLKSRLENYVANFNGKVRLLRNSERQGLIRSRSIGAQNGRGDVVIFLDAHCEANVNWLPPLLAPIAADRRVMTVPIIDGIDMNTWAYRRQYGGSSSLYRGIFEWGLLYKETEITEKERNRRKYATEPFRSPTHAGGLFAINRKWFEELGYYDPGLQIWGGEQYELSFKIWQCGGGILFVPCSRVGHVYRARMPYGFGKLSGKPVVSTNLKRVVETWMDEYKKYYYIREPFMTSRDAGDLTEQRAIRQKNKCKSFKWYMENVAYDVIKSYPLLPDNHVWGEAKNTATGRCLDTMGQAVPGTVGATSCHGYGGNQLFRLNIEGQLTSGEWCVTVVRGLLQTGHCTKGTVDGPWQYSQETKQIARKATNLCLSTAHNDNKLDLRRCDVNDSLQRWIWTEIYQE